MNLITLIFAVTQLSLGIVAFSLAYLYGKAFESVSRNTEASSFVSGQILLGAGFVEFCALMMIGMFMIVLSKLPEITVG